MHGEKNELPSGRAARSEGNSTTAAREQPERYCQCCGVVLTGKKTVWLEYDQRISAYHDFGGVPEDKSQGGFEFGAGCAVKKRKEAREALKALAPYPFCHTRSALEESVKATLRAIRGKPSRKNSGGKTRGKANTP